MRPGPEPVSQWAQRRSQRQSPGRDQLIRYLVEEPAADGKIPSTVATIDRDLYVDAPSFALMEREDVPTAFAFDHHFTQRGLTVLP